MIPTEYILILLTTTLLVITQLFEFPNKYVTILLNSLLSFCTGSAWAYLIIKDLHPVFFGNEPSIFIIVLETIFLGLLLGFILMLFIWHDLPSVPQNTNGEQETYTEDTLLGMTGVVVQKYSEDSFLCQLTDKSQTSIVVYIDDAESGDKFVIKKIENGKIFGSIIYV